MWGTVLFLALNAAQDPVRIGIVVLLISRPRPMPNLLAYWLGLMASGFGAALAALFLLHDFMLPVMRVVTSVAANPVVPPIQIALGVVALSTAAMLAAPSSVRQAAYALMPGGDSSAQVLQPKPPTVFSRLSLSLLDRPVAEDGVCRRPVYVDAARRVLGSDDGHSAPPKQVPAPKSARPSCSPSLAFAIVEIPLVSCLVSPAKTQAVVMQLHYWLRAHRRPIFVFILGVVGVLMVTKGVGRL